MEDENLTDPHVSALLLADLHDHIEALRQRILSLERTKAEFAERGHDRIDEERERSRRYRTALEQIVEHTPAGMSAWLIAKEALG